MGTFFTVPPAKNEYWREAKPQNKRRMSFSLHNTFNLLCCHIESFENFHLRIEVKHFPAFKCQTHIQHYELCGKPKKEEGDFIRSKRKSKFQISSISSSQQSAFWFENKYPKKKEMSKTPATSEIWIWNVSIFFIRFNVLCYLSVLE